MKKIKPISILFLSFIILNSCGSNENGLKLVNSYSIKVPEPSGLAFAKDNEALYTVSDKTNRIYKISLEGDLIEEINCEAEDLEGIFYCRKDESIWLAQERKRKLMKVNLKGEELQTVKLDVNKKHKNSGIEGLTMNSKKGNFFCLNEKKPGLLIKLDKDGKILKKRKLKFAKDYSGIYYEEKSNKLWIVSDKSQTISKCNMKGIAETTYKTKIESMEGIVVDSENQLIYVVSDELEKLFVFKY